MRNDAIVLLRAAITRNKEIKTKGRKTANAVILSLSGFTAIHRVGLTPQRQSMC